MHAVESVPELSLHHPAHLVTKVDDDDGDGDNNDDDDDNADDDIYPPSSSPCHRCGS